VWAPAQRLLRVPEAAAVLDEAAAKLEALFTGQPPAAGRR
jgi:hypothetical protein